MSEADNMPEGADFRLLECDWGYQKAAKWVKKAFASYVSACGITSQQEVVDSWIAFREGVRVAVAQVKKRGKK